jgi:hypothetical protein
MYLHLLSLVIAAVDLVDQHTSIMIAKSFLTSGLFTLASAASIAQPDTQKCTFDQITPSVQLKWCPCEGPFYCAKLSVLFLLSVIALPLTLSRFPLTTTIPPLAMRPYL